MTLKGEGHDSDMFGPIGSWPDSVFCEHYLVFNIKKELCIYSFLAVNLSEPYRELFVWSVFYCRMPLAQMFWEECPDQLGSALIASSMFKSLAREAKSVRKLELAEELDSNAALVVIFCCSFVTKELS